MYMYYACIGTCSALVSLCYTCTVFDDECNNSFIFTQNTVSVLMTTKTLSRFMRCLMTVTATAAEAAVVVGTVGTE